jgi:hypothetical protein
LHHIHFNATDIKEEVELYGFLTALADREGTIRENILASADVGGRRAFTICPWIRSC